MKISILVVTYNQEKYIQQCLDSILMQQIDFEYEVIIGDDCSTDNTAAICDLYAEKYSNFHVYHHPKNLGHVGNWEFCLNQCHGEYIAILEGDDFWIDNRKLQKQVDYQDFLDNNYHLQRSMLHHFLFYLQLLNKNNTL